MSMINSVSFIYGVLSVSGREQGLTREYSDEERFNGKRSNIGHAAVFAGLSWILQLLQIPLSIMNMMREYVFVIAKEKNKENQFQK